MTKVHSFLIRASFGPADVLAMLRRVTEDARHRGHGPEFAFDWLKQRAGLSASSSAGVEALVADLRRALAASKAGEGALLIGKTVPLPNGRHEAPIGIAVMDAAVFGELIGQTLVESGVLGLRVIDGAAGCQIEVPGLYAVRGLPYAELITEFPVPPYISIRDEGVREVASKPEKKTGKKKARK